VQIKTWFITIFTALAGLSITQPQKQQILTRLLSTMTYPMLYELTKALPHIARRCQLKLVEGGKKDAAPEILKGDSNYRRR
jgi:hypothetical protein